MQVVMGNGAMVTNRNLSGNKGISSLGHLVSGAAHYWLRDRTTSQLISSEAIGSGGTITKLHNYIITTHITITRSEGKTAR